MSMNMKMTKLFKSEIFYNKVVYKLVKKIIKTYRTDFSETFELGR